MGTMKYLFLILFCLALQGPLLAQQTPALSASEKTEVIETVSRLLNEKYVFPDKAKAMGAFLQQRHKEKAYQSITDYRALAHALAKDLQTAHQDLHLGLYYAPQQVENIRRRQSDPGMLQEELRLAQEDNFGFVRVEVLPGNIGYLDFRQFYPVSDAAKSTVAAAMRFIENTEAVIVDLRKNIGGEPDMVQLLISYFLDEKPVHYNTIFNRITNTTQDYYSLARVDGKKRPGVDLYVLTSEKSFSAAEEFTYDLKNLKRATIIGETTTGGAHPTEQFVVNDYLVLNIPYERAINPFTKTNWEGTGITPDVKIAAENALEHAQLLALQKMLANTADTREKNRLMWHLQTLEATLTPSRPAAQQKAAYAGVYGDRVVSVEGGELYYQRSGRDKMKLIPLNENTFMFEELPFLRVQFEKNAAGEVVKLVGIYDNGNRDEAMRTSNL